MEGYEQVPFDGEMNDEASVPVPEEAIRERAHELYERAGRQDGMDLENWLQAESELRAEIGGQHESMAASG